MMHPQTADSVFVKHVECLNCGSSDGNSLYSDGHSFCFVCNTHVKDYDAISEEYDAIRIGVSKNPFGVSKAMTLEYIDTFEAIHNRGITKATVEKFKVGIQNGNHYYPYYSGSTLTAYKVRNVANKAFTCKGTISSSELFGQCLFHSGGKYVTITEGEIDALSVYQMTGSQWPVVSIKNGAQSALKDCKDQFEWLNSFETVVICFDADTPGVKAAAQVAELFGAKAKVMKHKQGHKDANEYLQQGDIKTFVNEWWRAEAYIPDGIVQASSLWELVSAPEEKPAAWYPWKGLNDLLHGIRTAELITVTAGSGLGKSQFLREILYHLLLTTDINIGGMFLEESVKKTAKSIMSLHANKKLHLPESDIRESEIKGAFDATLGTGRVYLFDHFGSMEVDNVLNRIRYMAKALDCKVIFLDHLSIIMSGQDANGDERKAIDNLMTKLRTLVQETGITLFVVSHLRRPTGNAGHEDGQAVSLSQLRGSGAIAQLSDAVVTLERNSMSEDIEERHTTKVSVAKNRFSGDCGPACHLRYNADSGRMLEVDEGVL